MQIIYYITKKMELTSISSNINIKTTKNNYGSGTKSIYNKIDTKLNKRDKSEDLKEHYIPLNKKEVILII